MSEHSYRCFQSDTYRCRGSCAFLPSSCDHGMPLHMVLRTHAAVLLVRYSRETRADDAESEGPNCLLPRFEHSNSANISISPSWDDPITIESLTENLPTDPPLPYSTCRTKQIHVRVRHPFPPLPPELPPTPTPVRLYKLPKIPPPTIAPLSSFPPSHQPQATSPIPCGILSPAWSGASLKTRHRHLSPKLSPPTTTGP